MDLQRMRFLMNRRPAVNLRTIRALRRATRTTSVIGSVHGGGGHADPVADGVTEWNAAKDELLALDAELRELRSELKIKLSKLHGDLECTVMDMRYIHGYTVRAIAYSLHYSERHIFRVLVRAEKRIMDEQ